MAADPQYDAARPTNSIDTETYRAGCYNRGPMQPGYWAPNRVLLPDGRYLETRRLIPHAMSTRCRQILPLPECEGCQAPKDHEYIERMTRK